MASTEPYISSIELWPMNWAPRGYALCNGQTLTISQNQALYSLIGITYGGNGTSNFMLPNLQGRVPVGMGTLSSQQYILGKTGGASSTVLTTANVPLLNHTHQAVGTVVIKASDTAGQINTPGGYYLANSPGGDGYTDSSDSALAAPDVSIVIQPAGIAASQPVSLMPPYLVLNFIIATNGLFPQRP